MKAIQVTYSRLFNLGNYDNEKIEVVVALEDGETAEQGLARAKAFVDSKGPKAERLIREYEAAKHELEHNKRNLTLATIERFEKLVTAFEAAKQLDSSL